MPRHSDGRRSLHAAAATGPFFQKLNDDWNAEPNAPHQTAAVSGSDLFLRFYLNPFQFTQFQEGDRGILRFIGCTMYRLGGTNDEGWYRGQCRYSRLAPAWGEFYEITGQDPHMLNPPDWTLVGNGAPPSRHFLFYFRDETFECIAADWLFEPNAQENALFRYFSQAKPTG